MVLGCHRAPLAANFATHPTPCGDAPCGDAVRESATCLFSPRFHPKRVRKAANRGERANPSCVAAEMASSSGDTPQEDTDGGEEARRADVSDPPLIAALKEVLQGDDECAREDETLAVHAVVGALLKVDGVVAALREGQNPVDPGTGFFSTEALCGPLSEEGIGDQLTF